MSEGANTAEDASADTGPKPPKLPLILGLLNTVAILAAAGTLAYTKILFKRPPITEDGERARLERAKTAPKPEAQTGYVTFDPLTINISPSPPQPKAPEGAQSQLQGKLHYANIGFSLELHDISRKEEVEAIKPLIADQFLSLVGHKQFHELTSVQGRYVLKTQLIETVNALAAKRLDTSKPDPGPLVTDLFFNQFVVQ